jgi:hypothetical protein
MGVDIAAGDQLSISRGEVKVGIFECDSGILTSYDCVEGKPALLVINPVGPMMGKRWTRILLYTFNHPDDLRRWVVFKAKVDFKDATMFEVTENGLVPVETE